MALSISLGTQITTKEAALARVTVPVTIIDPLAGGAVVYSGEATHAVNADRPDAADLLAEGIKIEALRILAEAKAEVALQATFAGVRADAETRLPR